MESEVLAEDQEYKAPATKSFRVYLQNELLRRCRNNSGYSLRSFARALQINPSSLSRIIRGERPVSEKMKRSLGLRLGLTEMDLNQFSVKVPGRVTRIEHDYQQLSLDIFAVISDWYHYAILELVHVKRFKSDPRWIARALGITVSEVNAAAERLKRLNLLSVGKRGQWVNHSGSNTNVSDDMKNGAYKKLQRQVLEMALKGLEEIPIELRDQSSMTMAIDKKRLPEAIEKITKFRRELSRFFEQDLEKDEVYQLGISLYPLTKFNGKEKTK